MIFNCYSIVLFCLVLHAVAAGPAKMKNLCCNNTIIVIACKIDNFVGVREENILNTSASAANNVLVWRSIGIKPVYAVAYI